MDNLMVMRRGRLALQLCLSLDDLNILGPDAVLLKLRLVLGRLFLFRVLFILIECGSAAVGEQARVLVVIILVKVCLADFNLKREEED